MYSFASPAADAGYGITLPDGPDLAAARASVEPIGDFERLLAKNLRQPNNCGREWIRALLDDPAPDAETKLAALISQSGGRSIRENEAVLKLQLRIASDRAETYRSALETLASNPHFPPAQYPAELRAILVAALGREY